MALPVLILRSKKGYKKAIMMDIADIKVVREI